MDGIYTPTQTKILKLLADGLPHHEDQLREMLNHDSQDSKNMLQKHICYLRKVLRVQGQDIVCEYAKRRLYYRHVRLLGSAVK